MYIARILYPVKVLGPGNRIGIWFSGCEHQCKNCSNPELWKQQENQRISLKELLGLINNIEKNYLIDGFTLTGGDPFFQSDALRELLPYLYSISNDILLYTGYRYEELVNKYPDVMKYVAVIIDGKYIEEENHGTVLRGSENQRIIYLNSDLSEQYEMYMSDERSKIQNFTTSDGIVSVGIHLPDYEKKLTRLTIQKGLEEL